MNYSSQFGAGPDHAAMLGRLADRLHNGDVFVTIDMSEVVSLGGGTDRGLNVGAWPSGLVTVWPDAAASSPDVVSPAFPPHWQLTPELHES